MEKNLQQEQWQAKIQQLVNLAFTKGLTTAIAEARKLGDPFLVDKFHDTLLNELYQELIEREHKK